MYLKVIRPASLLLAIVISVFSAKAQSPSADTLKLTLKQAEDQFLKSNLQIIAQRYNIDIASANVITARVFPNPDFSFSNSIADYGNSNHSPFSEQAASVSQLFTTAGKRNKNIQLAKIAVDQAKYQFFDFLRTMKYTLHSDFYTVYYQEQSAKVYTEEINSLTKILSAYKEQLQKGNIAEKEVLRIQSQLYSLRVEYSSLLTGIDTTESDLRLLLKASPKTHVEPLVDFETNAPANVEAVPYQQLIDSAYTNRYDLRLQKANVDYSDMNLRLQKANAVPDITLSYNYDKEGSFANSAMSAGIAFSLPFFNRNQGNIKQAQLSVEQSKIQLQSQQNQVESDVATSYKNALRLEELNNGIDPKFKQDYTHLIQEVVKNYIVRNIGLLDFLNYYDDYKNNTLLLNNAQLNRVLSLEQLNFVTGTSFFNKQNN